MKASTAVWAAVCITASTPVRSSDLAVFNLIGFSESGRYLAWEQYGVQDGSGFPYCNLQLLDLDESCIVGKFRVLRDDHIDYRPEDFQDQIEEFDRYLHPRENEYRFWEERAREEAHRRAASLMDSLGIIPGNTGRLCVHHPLTDLSGFDRIEFVTGMLGPAFEASPRFRLLVEELEADTVEDLYWISPPKMLRLSLVWREDTLTLADDVRMEENELAYGYGVRDVITYRDLYVVVVLFRWVPGFEGPDVRFRVVTGRLPRFESNWWYSNTG
jgi:predicted secreted protein